jgi:beta-glucosidase
VTTTSPATLDVDDVLSRLTLEEKAELLDGSDFWHTQPIERLGVPAVMVTDGPHGLRKQSGASDHVGLHDSVPATCFPPAAGLVSSWDPQLLRRVGVALGDECRAERVAVLLGPGVNMKRSPLNGRNFEYFSEDPLLAGALAAGLVQGVQSRGVGTSLKHFAANNQETDRMTVDARIDERTLREIYLPAFERVVKDASPWTVMCSYNRLNGTYASEHPWLLTGVLRDDWGYDGLVVSDWGAVNGREDAVAAGMDLEMPSSGGAGTRRILDAIRAGRLSEADVDRAARRVLALVAKSLPALQEDATPFDADAHHALAREAASAAAVLLKNEDAILPLAPTGGKVAVIGEFARTPRYQGAGSSQVNPTRLDTALDALVAALPDREVAFAPGFAVDAEESDATLVQEAVATASDAEAVVLFLGLPAAAESEGYDRSSMDLPAPQIALVAAIADANPNLVVVLSNGSVVTLDPWQDRVKAVLEGWLLGQAGGSATADLLTGAVNPSGRLGETIPMRFEDNPAIGNFPGEAGVVRYGEGLLIGYRWYDAHRTAVAYPFGHGLGYTTFSYTDLGTEVVEDSATPRVVVTATVTNTGDRAGTETVQVYVTDPEAAVHRPEQELRGFARLTLEPGGSQQVRIELDARAFAYWDVSRGRFVVEGGEFGIRVAASSRDVRLVGEVVLAGEALTPPVAIDSTVEQLLAHPGAAEWVRRVIAGHPFEAMLFDPQHGAMMRAIPLVRLSRFPGSPVTEQDVADAVARFGGAA